MQFISQLLEHPALFAYFAGANNYTWLQFRNGERRLLAKPITYFEERLPAFVRIHKTALINPACVQSIHRPARAKMPGMIRMHDGTELPVARRRWNDVVHLLETSMPQTSPPTNNLPGTSPLDALHSSNAGIPTHNAPYVAPPLLVIAVMQGDALLLTRECIDSLGLPCLLHRLDFGAELASSLLMSSLEEQPALIILDARTNRTDRMLALRALKSHPRLRAIPVVWLAAPGDNTMQAYTLDANSVVVVSQEPAAYTRIIEQLCRYWLTVVQLPPQLGPSKPV